VRERLGCITARVDDDCAFLMGYFDVHLRPLSADDPAGHELVAVLEAALAPE
jgi:hypothetical protein